MTPEKACTRCHMQPCAAWCRAEQAEAHVKELEAELEETHDVWAGEAIELEARLAYANHQLELKREEEITLTEYTRRLEDRLAAIVEDTDCICGCAEHEDLGGDGLCCEQMDHACIQAPHSIGVMLRDAQARLAAVVAILRDGYGGDALMVRMIIMDALRAAEGQVKL